MDQFAELRIVTEVADGICRSIHRLVKKSRVQDLSGALYGTKERCLHKSRTKLDPRKTIRVDQNAQ